jgi:uncharacterized protein YndB with AHSA1/START domain
MVQYPGTPFDASFAALSDATRCGVLEQLGRADARTTVERKPERELVITQTFNGPARIVFEAWTKPELLKIWWAPKSTGVSLLSCEADVRVGGRYRFEIGHEASTPMAFFGRYIEEKGDKTLLIMHELYPSKETLDSAVAGMEGGRARRSRNWTSFSSA